MSMHVVAVHGCQMVNIFSHTSTLCTNDDKGQVCKVQVSEVLKLNPFKREACFKLMQNETTIHQIRASWKNLLLTCEKVTDYFTRDTSYEIIDSKRCPHVGSCVGSKCARINSTSLIPELAVGNGYPGNTYCVESCGGPGCDCFYWSSGCLFYRIYLKPVSSTVFEVFHCNRWAQTVAIDFTHFDAQTGKTNEFTALMLPNVPIRWESFSLTLSSVSMAPIPLLQSSFISNGNNTALWDNQVKPALRCPTSKAARTLRCEIFEQCTCNPAETKANCNCLNVPILKQFEDLQRRMPVILPSITFEESIHGVKASVQNMLSTEIIVTLQEDLRTNLVVDNDICTVENTQLIGCYNCEKGAHAKIKCFASRSSKAEIICEGTSFTAPCGKRGIESVMRISPTQAMVRMKCSVSCGEVVTTFEVGGILKYTATFETVLYKWLTSNSKSAPAEIQWPDFYHLFDVLSQWYKTVLIAGITLIAMLGITYALISTCGLRCVVILAKLIIKPIRTFYKLAWRLCFAIMRSLMTKSRSKIATKLKL
ncbi:unnamed protein product [Cylicostephanus goldi]|uniref:Phlebovirus glycoprotein G2 fusion domain-containing protein n=1 Tax=Cylicostephanus goldi TaxID=71465 RepID=A0A3P6SJN2_CYLGO|nr:unnamed protein product [Cylicostephanus goldi]